MSNFKKTERRNRRNNFTIDHDKYKQNKGNILPSNNSKKKPNNFDDPPHHEYSNNILTSHPIDNDTKTESGSDVGSTETNKTIHSTDTQWSGCTLISHGEAARRKISEPTSKNIQYLEPESVDCNERFLENKAFENLLKRNRNKRAIIDEYPISFILGSSNLKYSSNVTGIRRISNMSDIHRIKQFECYHRTPLLSDLWDTLCLLILQCNIRTEGISYGDVIRSIMEKVPGVRKYAAKVLRYNNEKELDDIVNFASNSLIGRLFECSQRIFHGYYPHICCGNDIKYKLDGVWQIHIEIGREINKQIETESHWHRNGVELHVAFWVNGVVKVEGMENDDDDDDDDNKMDNYIQNRALYNYDDDDIDTEDDEDAVVYDGEDDDIGNRLDDVVVDDKVDINILMKEQKHLNITKIEQLEDELLDYFTIRVCQHESCHPALYEAVMILFDTSNPIKVTAYIWKQKLNYYEKHPFDHDFGDYRVKAAQCRHFKMKYNGNKLVDIGKYVCLDIFILNESSIHSYWNICGKTIRFISSHAVTIWRRYYKYDTLYDKMCDEYRNLKELEEYIENNAIRLKIKTDIYRKGQPQKTKKQIIDFLQWELDGDYKCFRDFEPAQFRKFYYNVTGGKLLKWGHPTRNGYEWINDQ